MHPVGATVVCDGAESRRFAAQFRAQFGDRVNIYPVIGYCMHAEFKGLNKDIRADRTQALAQWVN